MMKQLSEIVHGNSRWYSTAISRRLVVGASVLLPVAAAALVYSRFLGQWLFRDDVVWLQAAKNPDFLDFLKGSFTLPRGPTPYWRPLADFYFFAMYRMFSLQALPYHLVNVLLHGATAAATVLLIQRVTRSLATGLLAGLLFAVAPAYGEGVVWISTVGTSMAALFSVTTMVLFLKYLEGEGGRGTLVLAETPRRLVLYEGADHGLPSCAEELFDLRAWLAEVVNS